MTMDTKIMYNATRDIIHNVIDHSCQPVDIVTMLIDFKHGT